jgi:iron-sulfur cluster repair protein YtfE (RIC family)
MLTAHHDSLETVTGCLHSDHERLERLLREAGDAVEGGDVAAIERQCLELGIQLRNHMKFEDRFLFPIVERLCGVAAPTCVLRREHLDIEDRLVGLSCAIYLSDLAAIRAEFAELVSTLASHHGREERVVYPLVDRSLDDTARSRLVDDILLRR